MFNSFQHNLRFECSCISAFHVSNAYSVNSERNENRFFFLSFILFTLQRFLGDCTCLSLLQRWQDVRIRNWGRGNNELVPRNSLTLGSAGALPIYPPTLVALRCEYATLMTWELPPVTNASQSKGERGSGSHLGSLFGRSEPHSRPDSSKSKTEP